MSTIHDSYFGVADESSYGTAVAASRFYEMASEDLAGVYERIESEAFRAGQRVLHRDRFVPNPKGAGGSIELEVLDKGFGLLLKHCLGAVSTGAEDDGFYPHTFSVGDLAGKSFTAQVGRVDNAGVLHPFTYEGGKVTSWELSNDVDGILKLNLSLDFAAETVGAGAGAYAAQTPSYPAGSQLFTFRSGVVEIASAEFAVSTVSVGADNGLRTDRWSLGGGKREPLEQGLRAITWAATGEFEGLAHANRVAAAVASSAYATLTATWETPQGATLAVSIGSARFDEGAVNFSGAEIIEHGLSGIALWDGSTSPVSIVYTSPDATP